MCIRDSTLTEQIKRHTELTNTVQDLDTKIAEAQKQSSPNNSAQHLIDMQITQYKSDKQKAIDELNSIGDINTINAHLNKIMEHSDELDSTIDDFKTNARLLDEYSDVLEVTNPYKVISAEEANKEVWEDGKTNARQQEIINAVADAQANGTSFYVNITEELASKYGITSAEDIKALKDDVVNAMEGLRNNKVKPTGKPTPITPSTEVNNKPNYNLQEDDWTNTDSSNITENQQHLVNAVDKHIKEDKPKTVKELTAVSYTHLTLPTNREV